MDIVISDLAAVTGNPTSRYQTSANIVDVSLYSSKVNALTSETFYNAVVGTTTQVANSKATHSTIQSAITSCPTNGRILILEGTYTENITIPTTLNIEGKGRGCVLNGSLSLSASYCSIRHIKVTANSTINVGANKNFVRNIWLATGVTLTDSGTGNSVLTITE
jgi:hypothetical protein